jgi:hypothetical protein
VVKSLLILTDLLVFSRANVQLSHPECCEKLRKLIIIGTKFYSSLKLKVPEELGSGSALELLSVP